MFCTLEANVYKKITKALISQGMTEMHYGSTAPSPKPLAQMYFGIQDFLVV